MGNQTTIDPVTCLYHSPPHHHRPADTDPGASCPARPAPAPRPAATRRALGLIQIPNAVALNPAVQSNRLYPPCCRTADKTLFVRHHGASFVDPAVAIFFAIMFLVGIVSAVVHIAPRRWLMRKYPRADIELTLPGTVAFGLFTVTLIGTFAVREMYPESDFGTWIRSSVGLYVFLALCFGALLVVIAFLGAIGHPAARRREESDV